MIGKNINTQYRFFNNGVSDEDCPKNKASTPLDTYKKFVRTQEENFKINISKMRTVSANFLASDNEVNRGYASVCLCGRKRIDADGANSTVTIAKGAKSGKMFYSGLMKCGSVWRCPVCSYKITKGRQIEVFQLSNKWLSLNERTSNKSGRLSFITLTLRHRKEDNLKHLLDLLLSEFRKYQRSKVYKRLEQQYNIRGFIKTLEIKYSFENGWHPHLHLLYFHTSEKTKEFHKEFLQNWCKRKNIKASIKAQNAKDVYTEKGISDYVTKWDMSAEMTQSNLKFGASGVERFTPFGILHLLTINQFSDEKEKQQFENLFSEYVKATKGRHMIGISKSLKAEFDKYEALSEIEIKTDAEHLEDEQIDSVELQIHPTLFDELTFNNIHTLFLIVFERDGLSGVTRLLTELNLHQGLMYDRKTKTIFKTDDMSIYNLTIH